MAWKVMYRAVFHADIDDIKFLAIARKHFNIDPASLAAGCRIVPAGIVALIELQRDGYAYIKP